MGGERRRSFGVFLSNFCILGHKYGKSRHLNTVFAHLAAHGFGHVDVLVMVITKMGDAKRRPSAGAIVPEDQRTLNWVSSLVDAPPSVAVTLTV